ncbi:MAG: polyprenyl synthetase family protein [Clostridiales bacterium]|nr:polyprenyl synthetase family protein [Clostridiales bacterium]
MNNNDYLMYKKMVDEHLLDFLPKVDYKSVAVYDAMVYSLSAGGKRIRPVLLLAACDFCGGDVKGALPYACALEYIHTYSLIHDDLPAMDDDELRRGMATNHKVFGEATAILAGDGLLSSAFEVMSKDLLLYFDDANMLKSKIRAMYEISKGCGCRGMIAGQIADIEAEGKQCSKELLDYIHVNKTASLVIAAVKAGAHLGGADKETLLNLTDYAENLGLAFQVADDILDIYGNEAEMGKKTGVDAEKGKPTYPALYGLDQSKAKLNELTETAIEILSPYYDNAEFFTDIAKELAKRVK